MYGDRWYKATKWVVIIIIFIIMVIIITPYGLHHGNYRQAVVPPGVRIVTAQTEAYSAGTSLSLSLFPLSLSLLSLSCLLSCGLGPRKCWAHSKQSLLLSPPSAHPSLPHLPEGFPRLNRTGGEEEEMTHLFNHHQPPTTHTHTHLTRLRSTQSWNLSLSLFCSS